MISFRRTARIRDLLVAALSVGLAMLTRAEALLVFVPLILLAVVLGRKHLSFWRLMTTTVLPIFAMIGIYTVTLRASTGEFYFGLGDKSYESFEWNQSILTGGDLDKAREESRRILGTKEANDGSIFRAIMRNPPAFGKRILANIKSMPIYISRPLERDWDRYSA
jgi:hypothetical protein